jgi:hypothetical protein
VGVKPVDPATPMASAPSGVSGFFVNPVVRRGEALCAYPAKTLSDSQWELYNSAGQKVGTLSQGGASVCMGTNSLAAGLYLLRARSSFADGSASDELKKVVILP